MRRALTLGLALGLALAPLAADARPGHGHGHGHGRGNGHANGHDERGHHGRGAREAEGRRDRPRLIILAPVPLPVPEAAPVAPAGWPIFVALRPHARPDWIVAAYADPPADPVAALSPAAPIPTAPVDIDPTPSIVASEPSPREEAAVEEVSASSLDVATAEPGSVAEALATARSDGVTGF